MKKPTVRPINVPSALEELQKAISDGEGLSYLDFLLRRAQQNGVAVSYDEIFETGRRVGIEEERKSKR